MRLVFFLLIALSFFGTNGQGTLPQSGLWWNVDACAIPDVFVFDFTRNSVLDRNGNLHKLSIDRSGISFHSNGVQINLPSASIEQTDSTIKFRVDDSNISFRKIDSWISINKRDLQDKVFQVLENNSGGTKHYFQFLKNGLCVLSDITPGDTSSQVERWTLDDFSGGSLLELRPGVLCKSLLPTKSEGAIITFSTRHRAEEQFIELKGVGTTKDAALIGTWRTITSEDPSLGAPTVNLVVFSNRYLEIKGTILGIGGKQVFSPKSTWTMDYFNKVIITDLDFPFAGIPFERISERRIKLHIKNVTYILEKVED
jgi:hypothetical protein